MGQGARAAAYGLFVLAGKPGIGPDKERVPVVSVQRRACHDSLSDSPSQGAGCTGNCRSPPDHAGEVVAGAHHWANPVDGLFTANVNWAEFQPPLTGDDAFFTVAGPYTVDFTVSITNLSLQVSMGNVVFESSGSLYTYHLTGTAGVDVWNGSLRVGTGTSPLDLVADEALVVDIYPAREEPMPGITAGMIADYAASIGYKNVRYIGLKENAIEEVIRLARQGDLVITMGAGDVFGINGKLIKRLSQ